MKIELTTNNPTSHYGIPALLIDGESFGPADAIETEELRCASGAQLVCDMVRDGNMDLEEAASFCRQWPDGPQPTATMK